MAALILATSALTLSTSAWAADYKMLYKFQGGADGQYPYAGLIFDAVGNLYGTTSEGGAYGFGTAFKLTPNPDGSWTESVLHSFSGLLDGQNPRAGLIFDAAGNLYGTTYGSGTYGTVFKLSPNPDSSWTESVIHSFNGADGANPDAGLISDAAANLYGTTQSGGKDGHGVVFKLTPKPDGSWAVTVLHAFNGNWTDGRNPEAKLIFDAAGNLYGTTYAGGAYDYGTVFKLSPNPDGTWSESILYDRFAGRNGRWPNAGLALDPAGNLYGTTYWGGAYDQGTVFKLSRNPDGNWTRTKLHAFKGRDGADPYSAGLIFDAAGNLYGTTALGGSNSAGTAFKLTPNPDGSWTRSQLHAFSGGDGMLPFAGLIFDAAGNLYGTTAYGGSNYGVVFRITP